MNIYPEVTCEAVKDKKGYVVSKLLVYVLYLFIWIPKISDKSN